MPELALETQALVRTLYGGLMLVFFSLQFPFILTYFTTERTRGCLKSTALADRLFSPHGAKILIAIWMASNLMLALGFLTVIFGLINLLFCWFFFIRLRWASPLRGMGAPGFISYWLASFVFFMEYALYHGDPHGRLRGVVLFAFRFDFAVMMIDSGIHKIFHGYRRGLGMNYGMANPAWGYWPAVFKRLPASHPLFAFFNHSAYFFQILGGALLLFPATYPFGALIICGSFLLVKAVIRLGVLCDQLMLITVIYTHAGGWVHQALLGLFPAFPPQLLGIREAPALLNHLLAAFFCVYVALLPLVKAGMYVNLYGKKSLPGFWQRALERYTNTFGVILWRVFTIELIDYFVRVWIEHSDGKREPVTRYGPWRPDGRNRFLWVGESIMSVVVFNTERYFRNPALFRERALRYANTMPRPAGSRVVFEWLTLSPRPHGIEFLPAKEYRADPERGTLEETILNPEALAEQDRRSIAVHTSARPGSYAPAAR